MNVNQSISQTTAEIMVPGSTYTMQVDLGDRNDAGGSGAPVQYSISLYKDTIANILATTNLDTATLFPLNTDSGWAENVTVTYQALSGDAGSVLGVLIAKTSGGLGAVDNVRLDAEPLFVPEPSTATLASLGCLALLRFRRRRKSSRAEKA